MMLIRVLEVAFLDHFFEAICTSSAGTKLQAPAPHSRHSIATVLLWCIEQEKTIERLVYEQIVDTVRRGGPSDVVWMLLYRMLEHVTLVDECCGVGTSKSDLTHTKAFGNVDLIESKERRAVYSDQRPIWQRRELSRIPRADHKTSSLLGVQQASSQNTNHQPYAIGFAHKGPIKARPPNIDAFDDTSRQAEQLQPKGGSHCQIGKQDPDRLNKGISCYQVEEGDTIAVGNKKLCQVPESVSRRRIDEATKSNSFGEGPFQASIGQIGDGEDLRPASQTEEKSRSNKRPGDDIDAKPSLSPILTAASKLHTAQLNSATKLHSVPGQHNLAVEETSKAKLPPYEESKVLPNDKDFSQPPVPSLLGFVDQPNEKTSSLSSKQQHRSSQTPATTTSDFSERLEMLQCLTRQMSLLKITGEDESEGEYAPSPKTPYDRVPPCSSTTADAASTTKDADTCSRTLDAQDTVPITSHFQGGTRLRSIMARRIPIRGKGQVGPSKNQLRNGGYVDPVTLEDLVNANWELHDEWWHGLYINISGATIRHACYSCRKPKEGSVLTTKGCVMLRGFGACGNCTFNRQPHKCTAKHYRPQRNSKLPSATVPAQDSDGDTLMREDYN